MSSLGPGNKVRRLKHLLFSLPNAVKSQLFHCIATPFEGNKTRQPSKQSLQVPNASAKEFVFHTKGLCA